MTWQHAASAWWVVYFTVVYRLCLGPFPAVMADIARGFIPDDRPARGARR